MDLVSELRSLLGPDAVRASAEDLAPLLVDHRQLYRGSAAALAVPDSTEAVSRLLAFCNSRRIAVVPQGGNTGYCGGCWAPMRSPRRPTTSRRCCRTTAIFSRGARWHWRCPIPATPSRA